MSTRPSPGLNPARPVTASCCTRISDPVGGRLKEHPMSIETVAARLTEAVYPVALRYATVGSWVDLELELWNVLTETLQRMGTDGFELPQRKPTLEADVVNGIFCSSDKTFRGKQP